MKRNHIAFLLGIFSVAVMTLLSGCKKDEPTISGSSQPGTLVSNQARPTWTVTDKGDMTLSMTALVKVDLAAQYPDIAKDFAVDQNDLMAAFIGETCVDVRSPIDGLFFLYIAGANDQMVHLKYYSTQYKNIFEVKDAFLFVNDAHLGSVAEPYVPTFVVVK